MFEPMFDARVAVFGLPAQFVVFAVGIAGMAIGLLWLRRILGDDPDPQSFWATADRRSGPSWTVILGLGFVGLVTILGATILAVLSSSGPEGASGQAVALYNALLIAGAVLTGLAVLLAVRVAWSRTRR